MRSSFPPHSDYIIALNGRAAGISTARFLNGRRYGFASVVHESENWPLRARRHATLSGSVVPNDLNS